MNRILKQDRNSRQIQDIVPVSNLKAMKIKTLLLSPIQLDHHPIASTAVALMSLRCRTDIAPLSLCSCCSWYSSCCRSAVALAFAPTVAPSVAPAIAPDVALLSLLLLLCCLSDVAPLTLHYRSVISPMLLHCCSAAAAVTPDVAPLSPLMSLLLSLLLLLGLFMVVASRSIIRVTVAIGDCQVRVSSCQ